MTTLEEIFTVEEIAAFNADYEKDALKALAEEMENYNEEEYLKSLIYE